jgi:hypothetical protein
MLSARIDVVAEVVNCILWRACRVGVIAQGRVSVIVDDVHAVFVIDDDGTFGCNGHRRTFSTPPPSW